MAGGPDRRAEGRDDLAATQSRQEGLPFAAIREQPGMQKLLLSAPQWVPPVCQYLLDRDWLQVVRSREGELRWRDLVDWLVQPVSVSGLRIPMPRLALEIYASRRDLQLAFPSVDGENYRDFARWFSTVGAVEYRLTPEFVAPMRREWLRRLASSAGPLGRIGHRLWGWGMRLKARLDVLRSPQRRQDQPMNSGIGKMVLLSADPTSPVPPAGHTPVTGINLVGFLRSESGIGESARLLALAARHCGIPVKLLNFTLANAARSGDMRLGELDRDFCYPFNLIHCNADLTPRAATNLGEKFLASRYNIGYWAWELEEFPDRWLDSFRYLNEVWVPSRFCAEAVALKSPVPVLRMPHAIEIDQSKLMSREALGLPPDKFIFLTFVDVLSGVERKNPEGAVEAFLKAFGGAEDCCLVIKANNSHLRPNALRRVRDKADAPGVMLLDSVMTRQAVDSLVSACDCLLSLHRSEGFGLTIAEAMYLGKPVVVTGYSGNLDFTGPETAFLVKHRRVEVGGDSLVYPAYQYWAEPDLEHAASLMRRVYEDRDSSQRVAQAGQRHVREHLSRERVGRMMAQRLLYLARWMRQER